jgi:hypothetical protein
VAALLSSGLTAAVTFFVFKKIRPRRQSWSGDGSSANWTLVLTIHYDRHNVIKGYY